jgi:FtsZ-binding cell division protein ZapB
METLRSHMDTLVQFDELEELLAKSSPLKQKRAELARKRARLEKAVGDAEHNLSTAYTHHLEGLLGLREYELVRVKIGDEKAENEARLSQIMAEQAKFDPKNALENQWLKQYRAFRDETAPTKEMIRALIGRIVLEPMTNLVAIELNYADSFGDLKQVLAESGVADGQ